MVKPSSSLLVQWRPSVGASCTRSLCSSRQAIFSSLTGKQEPLSNGEDTELSWYSCGPTVYERAHMGHGVCYVQQDIAIRVLREKMGQDVMHVMNITDVDDKIIQRAMERGCSVEDVASEQEDLFWADMARLNVRSPTAVTRVSEYMDEIKDFIVSLLSKGPFGIDDPSRFAYEALDGSGSIYFDRQLYNRVFGQYPTLGQHGGAIRGSEGEEGEEKKHPHDFALWKSHVKESKEKQVLLERIGSTWSLTTPSGRTVQGRPGWHIECSAMCDALFGTKLTVHAGGCDLAFPHHTNEIAQIQALAAVRDPQAPASAPRPLLPWPRLFLHVGHLHIQGHKMSKSLKNFVTVDDFLSRYSATHLRLFCLMHHYRASVEYGTAQMEEVTSMLRKIVHFFTFVEVELCDDGPSSGRQRSKWSPRDWAVRKEIRSTQEVIDSSLARDFDTPTALQALIDLCRFVSTPASDPADLSPSVILEAFYAVRNTLEMFGVETSSMTKLARVPSLCSSLPEGHRSHDPGSKLDASALVQALVDMRTTVRDNALREVRSRGDRADDAKSELVACDTVRDQLAAMNIEVRDFSDSKSTWNWKKM